MAWDTNETCIDTTLQKAGRNIAEKMYTTQFGKMPRPPANPDSRQSMQSTSGYERLMNLSTATARKVDYDPQLGVFSGTMLVVGGVIGAGIFLSPAVVAQRVGSARLTLAAWGAGALIAIIGGFVYGELGARRPLAGGTYIYLRDAWGPLPAFLYGWGLFLVIATGAIAAVAITGAGYTAALLGLSSSAIQPIGASFIIVLTLLNIAGVRVGASTGNVLTILKLAAIAALVVAALFFAPRFSLPQPLTSDAVIEIARPRGFLPIVYAMSAALSPVLFSFGGWQQTNAVAEELRSPERTLPRALLFGVSIVVATYLLVNVAYLRALGVDGLARSSAPAADSMFVFMGPAGRTLIAVGIVASTVGFLCMVILMSARVYQAMAADGLFFQKLAALNPRTRTPVWALAAQGFVALVLLLSSSYSKLLDYVVFADWIFFGACAASLFVLRRIDKAEGRSVSILTPLHPYSTLLFVGAAMYVVVGSIVSNPINALRGAGLLALGLPVYAFWRTRSGTRIKT